MQQQVIKQQSVKREISGVQEVPKHIQAGLQCPQGMGLTATTWGCFKAVNITKTWAAASTHCALLKLQLASLHRAAAATNQQLIQLGMDVKLEEGRQYWVNLRRSAWGDRHWSWGNGDRLDDNSPLWWKLQNEPTNGCTDDSGMFVPGFGLMDFRGSEENYFLCAP